MALGEDLMTRTSLSKYLVPAWYRKSDLRPGSSWNYVAEIWQKQTYKGHGDFLPILDEFDERLKTA